VSVDGAMRAMVLSFGIETGHELRERGIPVPGHAGREARRNMDATREGLE